jgi:hypothetical protein
MTATDQYAEFRAISDRLWQVPSGVDGKHRYLFIVRQWWQHEPTMVVMIVQAINTFHRESVDDHGDYACYIGCPPGDADADRYQQARWVTENGSKLTEYEVSGFAFPTVAPDGIDVDYRP